MIIWMRPFHQGDSEAISRIVGEAFTEVYPGTLWADIASYWHDGLIVLLDDAEIIGVSVGVVEPDGVSRILILVVKPAYRKRGLGKMLLDRHIEICRKRDVKKVRLEVRQGNDGALRFYQREGFRVEGTLPCFYTDGTDAWQMGRAL